MFGDLLSSFETTPRSVNSPDLINLVILGILLGLGFISLKKEAAPSLLLDQIQTDQLRGYAVLTVMLGHLWAHVVRNMPIFVLGSPIELLLLLSGYGLTMSAISHHGVSLKSFISGRLKRTMLLYWLLTPVFLFLDFTILGRSYQWSDILLTLCGINFSNAVNRIDYVRWFITFLLLWYVIFFIAMRSFGSRSRILVLFFASIVILVVDYYVTHLGFRQVLAFPVGCAIAQYQDKIRSVFQNRTSLFVFLACMVMGSVILSKVWFNLAFVSIPIVPTIAVRFFDHIGDLLFGVSLLTLIGLLGSRGYYSAFLAFCGKISYELFLIHGAFLVRYNPVMTEGKFPLPVEFSLFLLFVILLALPLHKFMKKLGTIITLYT
jgi:peptidoglycan/LPS O-acetylase OafA/YrhL